MRSDTSTPDQRAHISEEMEKVGIKIGMSIKLYSAERNSIMLLKDELAVCSNKVPVDIPYLDWCRRLCIEPICEKSHQDEYFEMEFGKPEPTAEPVFDPSKPFEVRHTDSDWHNKGKNYYYVGKDRDGRHVIQDNVGVFEAWRHIRNIPEFNASMLGVGECMEITDPAWPCWYGFIMMKSENCLTSVSPKKGLELDIKYGVKGRRVDVEIKAKEV